MPLAPDDLRPLGSSGIMVSSVALGCWPIAGMTSLDVNDTDSRATIRAALEAGVNFFDTAYAYGAGGESERLLGELTGSRRASVVIATKGGIAWDQAGKRILDGRASTLITQCEESLRRLGMDYVDLYYLHAPDPHTPVSESATGIAALIHRGLVRSAGLSNATVAQLAEFHAVCPLAAVQPPYNMLQREIERDLIPWCREQNVAVAPYWPLLKGLLAGRLPRDFVFRPGDGRTKYPMFQGEEWTKNQDLLDDLRRIAAQCGKTVAQLVVNWTIHQPGITSALCGAKRPDQILETAGAMGWRLGSQELCEIDAALARRGTPRAQAAV